MNMNSIADSLRVSVPVAKQRSRAADLVNELMLEYKILKMRIKKEQSVNMICSVGHQQFDVYSVGVFSNDFVSVFGKTSDGTEFKTLAPVEQVSFTIVLTNKISEAPPREIGFDAIRREREKSDPGVS